MIPPAGFDSLPHSWSGAGFFRDLPGGIRQLLRWDHRRVMWSVALHLDAPWTVFGQDVPRHERASGLLAPASPEDPVGWLDRLRTPSAVATGLLESTVVERFHWWSEPLLAVLVLASSDPGRARSILRTLRDLGPAVAERAERVAVRLGRPPLGADLVAAPTHADALAMLTRTISADLGLARAHHRARRWLRREPGGPISAVLEELTRLAAPRSDETARWQLQLEELRTEYLTASGRGWPDDLPEVGAVGGWPVRRVQRRPLRDRSFQTHAGFCPRGRPADGRGRIDVFFDYGAFPVWASGGGGMTGPERLGLAPELTADLWSWAQSHDRREVPAGSMLARDTVAESEDSRLLLLAGRLEEHTGLAAPVRCPRGAGDSSCATERCLGGSD